MADVIVKHHASGGPPDPSALVDGPTYDNDPHIVEGLENVDNTSDADKPVSTAQAAADAAVAAAAAALVAARALPPIFAFEGDSLTDTTSSGTWPLKLAANFAFFNRGTTHQYGLGGDTAALMVGEYAAGAGSVTILSGQEAYFFLWAGTNDVASGTSAATIYGYLTTLWAAARASGYKVCAFTVMRRGDITSGQNDVRIALNALILSDPTLYDYIVRPDVYFTNTSDDTVFQQTGGGATVHMTATGNAILAQKVAAAILGTAPVYAAPLDALAYNGIQVNGSMEVSQEKGTGAVTGITASAVYIVDSVKVQNLGTSVLTAQQVADAPPGLTNSLKVTVTTAEASLGTSSGAWIRAYIEGYRTARLGFGTLNAQPVSIGFWVKVHRTGTYSAVIRNIAADRAYPFPFTVNVADAWEFKTVTIPGDVTGTWPGNANTAGLQLMVALACGSGLVCSTLNVWNTAGLAAPTTINGIAATSDIFQFTGLIVLPGIELPRGNQIGRILRPFDQELILCKRQYEKSFLNATAPVQNAGVGTGEFFFPALQAAATIQRSGTIQIVTKRAVPTITIYNPAAANAQVRDETASGDCSSTGTAVNGETGFRVSATGNASTAIANALGFHWTADARL